MNMDYIYIYHMQCSIFKMYTLDSWLHHLKGINIKNELGSTK